MQEAVLGAEKALSEGADGLTFDRTGLAPFLHRVRVPPPKHLLAAAAEVQRGTDVCPRLRSEREARRTPLATSRYLCGDLGERSAASWVLVEVPDEDTAGLDGPSSLCE